MKRLWVASLAATMALAGCVDDHVSPRDLSPPAAPRGFHSTTGDQEVFLSWLENTESDVSGYRIYEGPCSSGPGCPYQFVASTTGTQFTLTGLDNGETRFFAISAVDHAGNESDLSYDDVFDTPRPEGFNRSLNNFLVTDVGSGWDFSAFAARDYDDPLTDMYFGDNGSIAQMFVPDFATEIQDAGFASSLDAVDWAPNGGWSPTGSVELIVGHCYVVLTRTNNYAKFRVTSLAADQVRFDWAYQVDPGNPELIRYPSPNGNTDDPAKPARRPVVWLR
jgi:hypothetical protein